MASVLQPSDRETIERCLSPYEEIYSTAVKIYYAAQAEWLEADFTGIGILCHKDNVAYLRFLRFDDGELFLEEELYKTFIYGTLSAQLHYFEGKDRVIGLAFADSSDAETFHRYVTQADRGDFKVTSAASAPVAAASTLPSGTSKRQPAPIPTSSNSCPTIVSSAPSPVSSAPSPLSSSTSFRSATSSPTPAAPTSSGSKFTQFFRSMSTTFAVTKKTEEKEMEISGPTDVKHIGHIGWTAEGGFQMNKLPPELIDIFQKAGIKKRDLKNKETAQMVADIVNEELSKTEMDVPPSAAAAGGPPLPPPPPPPPSAASHAAGAPPPPPPPPPPPVASGGGPPPPPPPPVGNAGSARSTARPVEPPTNSRDNLLQSIREGKQLRQTAAPSNTDSQNRSKPQLNPTQAGNLASNLARAMEYRRTVLRENYSSGSEEDDDDW